MILALKALQTNILKNFTISTLIINHYYSDNPPEINSPRNPDSPSQKYSQTFQNKFTKVLVPR